ncbi:MAG: COG4315 family predicted lipoprotein [Solirubrobacterales bacterium]
MNRRTYAFALLALLALVIAGCGGGGSTTSETEVENGAKASASSENKSASSESSESSGGKVAVISLGHTKVGMVLVDSNGMTLYDFHKDKGTTSSCYGPCEQAWPPVTTEGKPTVGNGASTSKLSVTKRKDGTTQVVYAGHPLYTFVEDKKPGEANGNDTSAFGAQWYALKGNGEEAGG